MNLSGQQHKKLTEALVDAFPEKSSLEQMLSFELDINIDTIAGSNLQDIVFKLIKTSKSENWIEDLIEAARNSNPGNSKLKAIAEELLTNHPKFEKAFDEGLVVIAMEDFSQESIPVLKKKF